METEEISNKFGAIQDIAHNAKWDLRSDMLPAILEQTSRRAIQEIRDLLAEIEHEMN